MTRFQPIHPVRQRSLWLEEALANESAADRPEPLHGAARTEICIIGGGFTGLWAALRIKELAPTTDVAIVEADLCGSGASGRNGGLILGWWKKLAKLIAVFGEDEAIRLAKAAEQAVRDVGFFCERHEIPAAYHLAGSIWTITTPRHATGWDEIIATCARYGVQPFERLSPTEVATRTGSAVHLAGVLETSAAIVQPAILARGLRRLALEQGVRIYERSPVMRLERGNPPVVRTPGGAIVAEKVVLAINAWAASLPEFRRTIMPMSSDIIATAPIPDRLEAIGWTGHESITDSRMMVQYYRTTDDGRIVFGRGGGTLSYLGRLTPAFDHHTARVGDAAAGFRRIYPSLADVPITHGWSGPIDRTEDGLPFFGRLDNNPRILYGVGFSGTGVAQTRLGGFILAASALDLRDDWSTSPLNEGPRTRFPPEPARFFGGQLVRAAVAKQEDREEAGKPSSRLLDRIASLAPSGMVKGKHPQH